MSGMPINCLYISRVPGGDVCCDSFCRGKVVRVLHSEAWLGRGQVLRALMLVKQAMASDIPPVFEGTVEIDETYLGGT